MAFWKKASKKLFRDMLDLQILLTFLLALLILLGFCHAFNGFAYKKRLTIDIPHIASAGDARAHPASRRHLGDQILRILDVISERRY